MNRRKIIDEYWVHFLAYCNRGNWEVEATEPNFWKYYYELEYDGEE